VQVHLDGRGALRSMSLVAIGAKTSPEGWADVSRRVRHAVRRLRVRPNPWAAMFVAAGGLLVAAAVWLAASGLWRAAERPAASPTRASSPAA
jgi:broad specificity phosphatase PhoE